MLRAPLLFLAAVGCGPKRPSRDAAIPPFPAARIQSAMPAGLELTFALTVPGAAPRTTTWRVLESTDSGVTIRYEEATDGAPRVNEATHTWAELEAHAHFPPQATEWRDEALTVGGTTYPRGRVYIVHRVEDGHPIEEHFAFSLAHPGPPIQVRTLRHGEEQMRMELLRRQEPAAD